MRGFIARQRDKDKFKTLYKNTSLAALSIPSLLRSWLCTTPTFFSTLPDEHWPVIEPRIIEPRIIEPRIIEPRIIEPRIIEPRIIEPRIIEPRIIERKPLSRSCFFGEVLRVGMSRRVFGFFG